jgi:hypothetical protein
MIFSGLMRRGAAPSLTAALYGTGVDTEGSASSPPDRPGPFGDWGVSVLPACAPAGGLRSGSLWGLATGDWRVPAPHFFVISPVMCNV